MEAEQAFSCTAFPEDQGGIPEVIMNGSNDHKKPITGDNGIQWEKA